MYHAKKKNTGKEHNCNLKSKVLVHVDPFKIKYFNITIEHVTGPFDHAYFVNTLMVKFHEKKIEREQEARSKF